MRDISEEHGGDDCENGTDPKHAGVYGEVESADGEARGVASEHGEERSRTDYPQSRADSELALTADGAREDKIGDVGASDDKHETGGGKKNKENGSSAGSDLLTEEFGVDLEMCLGRIGVGMILEHRAVDGAKLGAGLIKSDAGS